jgi:heme/copper-type cytochrome/quinol oxidase subunit 2
VTRNTRLGLLVAAIAVAVVAIVIAVSGGGGNKDSGSQAASGTGTTTSGGAGSDAQTQRVTTFRLTLKNAAVVGGIKTLTAKKDDIVRIVVSSPDAPDQVHLHGYNIEKEAKPGAPAVIRFKANVEGAFELESHTAEHEGKEPLIGRLHVEP